MPSERDGSSPLTVGADRPPQALTPARSRAQSMHMDSLIRRDLRASAPWLTPAALENWAQLATDYADLEAIAVVAHEDLALRLADHEDPRVRATLARATQPGTSVYRKLAAQETVPRVLAQLGKDFAAADLLSLEDDQVPHFSDKNAVLAVNRSLALCREQEQTAGRAPYKGWLRIQQLVNRFTADQLAQVNLDLLFEVMAHSGGDLPWLPLTRMIPTSAASASLLTAAVKAGTRSSHLRPGIGQVLYEYHSSSARLPLPEDLLAHLRTWPELNHTLKEFLANQPVSLPEVSSLPQFEAARQALDVIDPQELPALAVRLQELGMDKQLLMSTSTQLARRGGYCIDRFFSGLRLTEEECRMLNSRMLPQYTSLYAENMRTSMVSSWIESGADLDLVSEFLQKALSSQRGSTLYAGLDPVPPYAKVLLSPSLASRWRQVPLGLLEACGWSGSPATAALLEHALKQGQPGLLVLENLTSGQEMPYATLGELADTLDFSLSSSPHRAVIAPSPDRKSIPRQGRRLTT